MARTWGKTSDNLGPLYFAMPNRGMMELTQNLISHANGQFSLTHGDLTPQDDWKKMVK